MQYRTLRSASLRGVAEEAPGAYRGIGRVVDAADASGLPARSRVVTPVVCVNG